MKTVSKKPPLSAAGNPNLGSDLPNGKKQVLYFIAKTYDVSNMKRLKQLAYRDILMRQQYLGELRSCTCRLSFQQFVVGNDVMFPCRLQQQQPIRKLHALLGGTAQEALRREQRVALQERSKVRVTAVIAKVTESAENATGISTCVASRLTVCVTAR